MNATTPAFADLHLLTVLAQTRSYTQAARRLGLSKGSVSMRIAELERVAGVPLVRRTTRSVGLTEAGQQLVEQTQGAFDTDRLRTTMQGAMAKSGQTMEAVAAARQAAIPAQRFGTPEEFGAACAFLCSRHAGYITGQNILTDGGAYPGTH